MYVKKLKRTPLAKCGYTMNSVRDENDLLTVMGWVFQELGQPTESWFFKAAPNLGYGLELKFYFNDEALSKVFEEKWKPVTT